MRVRVGISILGVTALMALTQNCSQVGFTDAEDFAVEKIGDEVPVDLIAEVPTQNNDVEGPRSEARDPSAPPKTREDEDNGYKDDKDDSADHDSNSDDGDNVADHDEEVKHSDDDKEDEAVERGLKCGAIEVADIELNVVAIYLDGARQAMLEGEGLLGAVRVSTLESGLRLKSVADLDSQNVRFVLGENGNVLIDTKGERHELRTPSQKQAGLKIQLARRFAFRAGEEIVLKAQFDAGEQLKSEGSLCALHPVWKKAEVSK